MHTELHKSPPSRRHAHGQDAHGVWRVEQRLRYSFVRCTYLACCMSIETMKTHLLVGGTPTDRMRIASGALSSGCAAAGGGGPRFGCRRRNSCAGVCPKWLI